MAYFNENFKKFFKDLNKNNNKEWFDANRKTYTKEVKEPFADFVDQVISQVQKHEPKVRITSKEAIFRINKDIRFSKDKTPYKTFVSANISEYGRKDKSYPGLYLELSADSIKVYGGAYVLENPTLYKVRTYIAQNLSAFQSAKSQKDFVKKFGTIKGE